jgi:hypothetical protein
MKMTAKERYKKANTCPHCYREFARPYRLNDHIAFSHTEEVRKFQIRPKFGNFIKELEIFM